METLRGVNGIRFFMVSPPGDSRGLIDFRIGAFSENGLKVVESMDDLRGLVTVSTPDQALALARLRTDPTTTWTFKKSLGIVSFEVMDSTQLPPYFAFGVRPVPVPIGRFRNGYEGVLTHREFTVMGFKPAKAVSSEGGFLIHRSVVFPEKDGPPQRANVVERVGRDGRYQVVEWRKAPLPALDGVFWDVRNPRE